jgi:histidine kinase
LKNIPDRKIPFWESLIFRLTLSVGIVLFISIFTWAWFDIQQQKDDIFRNTVAETERLSDVIRLGTRYAMLGNAGEHLNEIITNLGRHEHIRSIRIISKKGDIRFSNQPSEISRRADIRSESCRVCHKSEPPQPSPALEERTRIFTEKNEKGDSVRMMGIISPIFNECDCSENCHFHPARSGLLGVLDVVVSMEETDMEIYRHERQILIMALACFLVTAGIIAVFLHIDIIRPIENLIRRTRRMGRGIYEYESKTGWDDEIGLLADAITVMGQKTKEKQEELNRQRDEYQQLFEQVPCYITVVDKNYRLLRYNKAFTRQFNPAPGDHCYKVYKGRDRRCEACPVKKTFADGKSHYSEETGISKSGEVSHWLVQASPIRDAKGEIAAVMEMNLDITLRKRLEERIRDSEAKYRIIYDNIPNPVFALDAESLKILDCNDNQRVVYGYQKKEILGLPFMHLFDENDREVYTEKIKTCKFIDQARQLCRDGRIIFVNIRISPFDYMGKKNLLVTTSDITRRLIAEQQLVHAGKMTTLGEMATGIAHELNQPLTVIKTASSFLMRKIKKGEPIKDKILQTMSEEIDGHVNRASRIINHLREFGRKSEVEKEAVNVNDPLNRAIDMFSQQLKLREIILKKNFAPDLPHIQADPNRLEQVFVNLLINARDSIEEKWEKGMMYGKQPKEIDIRTGTENDQVIISVSDNGMGIPKRVRDRIFEPFYTTKKVGKGTGLGLSISYGIIQDYEGSIRLESTENMGSEFTICFPVSKRDSDCSPNPSFLLSETE